MTKDEALRLALDTLKEVREEIFRLMRNGERLYAEDKVWSTIISIQEALETKDEPVAWGMEKDGVILDVICPDEHEREEGEYTTPLYTTPQRTWVVLTEEDLKLLSAEWRIVYGAWMDDFARDIEAKLKEKNT